MKDQKVKKIIQFLTIAILIFVLGCEENSLQSESQSFAVYEDDKIFIQDQRSKKWDITHAVNQYGFDENVFRHGLGQNAIPPISNPEFLSPGNTGFPNSSDALVIGYSSDNITRAYALNILVNHEITNDWDAEVPIAVAY
jgi:Protein of unknown function (DUF3179)